MWLEGENPCPRFGVWEDYADICNPASSLARNHEKGVIGGVTPETYIAFLIIECLAYVPPFFLIPHR